MCCQAPPADALQTSPALGAVTLSLSIDGGTNHSAQRSVWFSQPAVSRVEPIGGPSTGGSAVTLHGSALLGISSCRFGGQRRPGATTLRHVVQPASASDTQLVCISPGHPRGSVELAVSEGGVHWTPAGSYAFYEQPVLTGLRPKTGRAGGGTLVRLLGFGLDSWAVSNYTRCRFGQGKDAPNTPLAGRTDTVLKCRTPPSAVGTVPVEITLNEQDYAAALPVAAFTFHADPLISAIVPSGGPVGGGTLVVISGSGFTPAVLTEQGLSDVTCRFGDAFSPHFQHTVRAQAATDGTVQCVTPTTQVVGYPEGRGGAVHVSVALGGGSDGSPNDGDFIGASPPVTFTYYTVVVDKLQPDGAPISGGTRVTLFGSDFGNVGSGVSNASDYGAADARCRFVSEDTTAIYGTVLGESGAGVNGSYLTCVAPPAPAGVASLLVSLNGENYNGPAGGGKWAVTYYSGVVMSALEPPGGPVVGGSLIRVQGAGLSAFGQTFAADQSPSLITMTALGALSGGGFVANGIARGELNLTRGVEYTLQVVALGDSLALTRSDLGGADALANLVTTGPNVNLMQYGQVSFVPDASLPDHLYYQSTKSAWKTTNERLQRISLYEPAGVSRLRFGSIPGDEYGTIRARNGSMLEAQAPAAAAAGCVSVVFSSNGAEEDYEGGLNYTYHVEPSLSQVRPSPLAPCQPQPSVKTPRRCPGPLLDSHRRCSCAPPAPPPPPPSFCRWCLLVRLLLVARR